MSKSTVMESRSIDMVPDSERHGHPFSQFTLWFGSTTQITAIVDGALAVVFGADAFWAIIGLLIGNIVGGTVMALHSAQGPKLGLPQMISSRAQFGVYGAVIPLVLVVLMYLGFASTGAVLSGQAVNAVFGIQAPAFGIIIFGALTAAVALLGYKHIHVLGRISSITGLIGFIYLTVVVLLVFDIPSLLFTKPFELPTFLTAIALSAGWQLTFGPYVADYSRYLPRATSQKATFWWTFLGAVGGSQWSMMLGALIGAASVAGIGSSFLDSQVKYVGELAGGGLIAILIYIMIVMGKLTINTLNAYGAFMCTTTITTTFSKAQRISQAMRSTFVLIIVTLSVIIAMFATADFLSNFKNFVLLLLMVFTPWSVVNLTDYYWVSKDRFDLPALYEPSGRYGKWNAAALTAYAVGVVIQIPFLAQAMYTGPIAKALNGADVSWIVGIIVTFLIYFPWARKTNVAPEHMIYPPDAVMEPDQLDSGAEFVGH